MVSLRTLMQGQRRSHVYFVDSKKVKMDMVGFEIWLQLYRKNCIPQETQLNIRRDVVDKMIALCQSGETPSGFRIISYNIGTKGPQDYNVDVVKV